MAKLVHYHAIPATLRGFSRGVPPVIESTPHGDIELGCLKRITTVFSDNEESIQSLIEKKDRLAAEYVAHIELAEAVIEQNRLGRIKATKAAKPAPATNSVDAEFEKFLNGAFLELAAYIKSNPAALKQLRTYTNGTVEAVATGLVMIKRDNGGATISMAYPLKTKLKVGDHVFIRDDGARPIPTAQAVWVNVKDAHLRANQLKQFF